MKLIRLAAIAALTLPFVFFGDHFAQAYEDPTQKRELIILECDGSYSKLKLAKCPK